MVTSRAAGLRSEVASRQFSTRKYSLVEGIALKRANKNGRPPKGGGRRKQGVFL